MANVSKKEFECAVNKFESGISDLQCWRRCFGESLDQLLRMQDTVKSLNLDYARLDKQVQELDKKLSGIASQLEIDYSTGDAPAGIATLDHRVWLTMSNLQTLSTRVDKLWNHMSDAEKSIIENGEQVDALARTVGRIAEDLEAPREKPVGSMPVDWVVRHVVWPSRYGHYFPEAWSILLHNNNSGQDSVVAVLKKEAKTVEQAIDIALESARV